MSGSGRIEAYANKFYFISCIKTAFYFIDESNQSHSILFDKNPWFKIYLNDTET